jgi:hypothetical protein
MENEIMGELKSDRPGLRNGIIYHRSPVSTPHGLNGHGTAAGPAAAREEMLASDALLLHELAESGANREEELSLLGSDPQIEFPGAADELAKLRTENRELRSIIAELKQETETASDTARKAWTAREKEYDSLLEKNRKSFAGCT